VVFISKTTFKKLKNGQKLVIFQISLQIRILHQKLSKKIGKVFTKLGRIAGID
jgi:hypothetical protein